MAGKPQQHIAVFPACLPPSLHPTHAWGAAVSTPNTAKPELAAITSLGEPKQLGIEPATTSLQDWEEGLARAF